MSDAVIVGVLSLLGVIFTAVWQNRKLTSDFEKRSELADARMDAKLEKHMAVTDTKLDELTREVREHNGFAKRVPVLEKEVEVINHRIKDLENK
mgnify:FL=1